MSAHVTRSRILVVAVGLGVLGPVILSRAQGQKESPHGKLALDCGDCHTAERWSPVEKTPKFRHDATGFALEASHARIACRRCHQSLVFDRVGSACVDCHKDVHRGELGSRCEACHTAATWTNQREMFRVHSRTRFPLLSVHASLDCAACHRGQSPAEYALTPAECGACHAKTYDQTRAPNHPQAGFPRQCEGCHQTTARSWHEATFRHDTFPLRGAHLAVACQKCHSAGYKGTARDCVGCHRGDYDRAKSPDHAAARFPTQCQNCHLDTAWRPASFTDHNKTRFPLTGAHQSVECARCHVGGRYAGTPLDCYACHQKDYQGTTSPNHASAQFPTSCQNCHNTGAWRPANFDHGKTAFPLTGAHTSVDCAKCHTNGRYAGTPKDCLSCHQKDYQGTTSPNHAAGGFPTTCQNCHTTAAWKPANFDHNATGFPLTGAHASVDCTKCHTNGRYAGTPKDCFSCHQKDYQGTTNPNHVASNFPTSCQTCHSTGAWRPASFNHNATGFPLTGAHARVDCASCHKNGRYAGTPKDCYSCHQNDYNGTGNPNHAAAGFPTQCQQCHSTSAWRPASFDHDGRYFPIYSGKHRGAWSSCQDCHRNANNYAAFECIYCHAHSNKADVDQRHRDVSGYQYSSPACYRCHPQGVAGDALRWRRHAP